MKKIVLFFGILFLFKSYLFAVYLKDFQSWRTTETCTADTNVLVATGVIALKDMTVSSGTAVAGASTFLFFNSSHTNLIIERSSSVPYDIDTAYPYPYEFYVVLSSGFAYTKTGTGCISCKWDWLNGVQVNRFRLGLK